MNSDALRVTSTLVGDRRDLVQTTGNRAGLFHSRLMTEGARDTASSVVARTGRALQESYEIKAGDTLIGIARRYYQSNGRQASAAQLLSAARDIAEANRLTDPDLILAGQKLDLRVLGRIAQTELAVIAIAPTAAGSPPGTADVGLAPTSVAERRLSRTVPESDPRVLERTLNRAVDKGYVPANERDQVARKIHALALKYGFNADDFALVGLIESDGFNPRASNGQCHGIIQFCGGAGRGADSVGYRDAPEAIRELGVLQQLDLADKYFSDVGLKPGGRADRVDLYLSVLTPAARAERDADTPLDIRGRQASVLYVDLNPNAAITRQSLNDGLARNGEARLQASAAKVRAVSVSTAALEGLLGARRRLPDT